MIEKIIPRVVSCTRMLNQVPSQPAPPPDDQSTHVFRSDMRPLLRICTLVVAIGSPGLFAATLLGQVRAGRFPSYVDLLLALVIPVLAAVATGLIFLLAVRVYTVSVLPGGLRCYDTFGLYHTVGWEAISGVEPVWLAGVPYLAINVAGRLAPLTLPLWLDALPAFAALVAARAGSEHPLAVALRGPAASATRADA